MPFDGPLTKICLRMRKTRAERFSELYKSRNQNMTDDGAENYVRILFLENGTCLTVHQRTHRRNCTLEKDLFSFERMVDGVPVNYIRNFICHMMNYPVLDR